MPGPPFWYDTRVIWDDEDAWFAAFQREAVVVPGEATERLGAAAKRAGLTLAVGVNEREEHGGTVYNTLLYFSPTGQLLGRHRKLVPTGAERTVWGMGDGSMLPVVDTPAGRVGGLICWENYMPLARFYLYSQGVDLWVAPTLDAGPAWVSTLRHIAREAGVHVIGASPCMRFDEVPAGFPLRERLGTYPDDDEWVWTGSSAIVAPSGDVLAGPLERETGILVAEVDVEQARAARRFVDPVGHYNRPDVFRLSVDTAARPPVVTDERSPGTEVR